MRIFDRRRDLCARIKACGRTPGRGTLGIVMPWRVGSFDRRWKTGKFAGEVLLLAETARNEVVAHESAHVALAWARRMGFAEGINAIEQPRRRHATVMMTIDSPEERFCYALGRIDKQIIQGLYDCGALK